MQLKKRRRCLIKPAVGLGQAIATGVPGFARVLEKPRTPENPWEIQGLFRNGVSAALRWRADLSYSVALHYLVRTKFVQVSAALSTAVAFAT
jgi:hypothetical protein